MPCRDFYDDHPEAYFRDVTEPALKARISFAESALCQVLDTFESYLIADHEENPDAVLTTDPLKLLNYKAAGIKESELRKWLKEHRELDAKMKADEQLRLKATALAKLTPEEKKALGL